MFGAGVAHWVEKPGKGSDTVSLNTSKEADSRLGALYSLSHLILTTL